MTTDANFLNLTLPEKPSCLYEPLNIGPEEGLPTVADKLQEKMIQDLSIPASLLQSADLDLFSRRVSMETFNRRMENMQKQLDAAIFGGYTTTCVAADPATTTDSIIESVRKLKETFPTPKGPGRFVLRPNRFLGSRKQYRFPKTKKRRIRRKWAKRPENYRFVPDPNFYVVGESITAHPETLKKLYAALGFDSPPTGEFVIDLMPFQAELLTCLANGFSVSMESRCTSDPNGDFIMPEI